MPHPSRRSNTSNRVFGTNATPESNTSTRVRITSTSTPNNQDSHRYTVATYTGTNDYSGTYANVFITLYGSEDKTSEIQLQKSNDHKNPYKSGQKDTFNITAKDLGYVYRINIRHDNTGFGPGWLLNKIVVVDEESNKHYSFPCNDWLFQNRSTGNLLSRELEVDAFPVIGINSMSNENSILHRTDKYKTEKDPYAIILRRGQTFKVTLKLAREYRPEADSFYFTLKTGDRPRDKDKTLITVTECLPKDFPRLVSNGDKWGFKMLKGDNSNEIIVEIFIPATALPAKYDVLVETDDGTVYQPSAPLYILFNPWCKEDEVFLDNEEELREYILRQNGQVYVGHWKKPRPRSWYFGQFEEVCLQASFYLLEGTRPSGRDSAIEVSRIISSKVNSLDNNGVLVGNWSGNYKGGKKPTSWMSTPAILEQYMREGLPVKYGQCWIFSSIFTTVMRCLGIPCRSVTNYSSAHDANGNCSNDKYLDEDWEIIKERSSDSVWNFHVWNDVWMMRKDLPPGYGGWQAVDATPQEKSQGLFQMGPASHRAIKEGEIDLPYDTGFVLAEVNADTIYWKKSDNGIWEVVHRARDKVGKNMSTKAVSSTKRNDVTDEYKFPEGSILEKASVKKAMIKTNNPAVKAMRKDVIIDIIPEKEDINVGENVLMDVKISNTCDKDLVVTLVVSGQVISYDGMEKAKLPKHKEQVTAKANEGGLSNRVTVANASTPRSEYSVQVGQGNSIRIKIAASRYLTYLEDDTMLRVHAAAFVESTGQIAHCEEIIDVVKPELNIDDVPTSVTAGIETDFYVTFKNPLNLNLTECEMYIDGSIIKDRLFIMDIGNVRAKGEFERKVSITPCAVGGTAKKSIIVSFSCKELGGLHANTKIQVTD